MNPTNLTDQLKESTRQLSNAELLDNTIGLCRIDSDNPGHIELLKFTIFELRQRLGDWLTQDTINYSEHPLIEILASQQHLINKLLSQLDPPPNQEILETSNRIYSKLEDLLQ